LVFKAQRIAMPTPSPKLMPINPSKARPIAAHILYVEDSVAESQLLRAKLADNGLSADWFATAEEALIAIAQTDYDLVLTDINLGAHMSGVMLAKRIRRMDGVRGEVPILALTAFDSTAQRIELFNIGIDDYVIKPVVEEELLARIRNLVERKYLMAELSAHKGVLEFSIAERSNELLAARSQLQAILDAIPDLLFVVDLDGCYHSFHAPHPELLAASPEDFIGKTIGEMLPPEAAAVCMAALQEAHENGASHGKQYRLDLPQGECWFELSISGKSLDSDSAQAPRFVALARNITDRKKAEFALLDSEFAARLAMESSRHALEQMKIKDAELERHRDHLEELVRERTAELRDSVALTKFALTELEQQKFVLDQHAVVSISDVAGRIIYGNDKFSELSGYSREEFMGQDHDILNSGYHPKGFFKAMYETIAQGKVWHGEVRNRAKDGRLYWVDTTVAAFMGMDGKPREFISVRTDITERKRIEEAALAASRAKSEFLANMSHEIRTPMNGVVGMVDILQQTELTAAQQRMVGTISDASLALLNILNDILDYSKIEAGKLAMESIPTHLREVVEGVAQLMVASSNGKLFDLSVFVSPSLPHWILCDPTRLRQVLLNLLGNAIKFTCNQEDRPARVLLHVEPFTLEDGRPGVQLRIIDNGIGISPESLPKLFQPFTQGDESTARRFGGTGLGLSISQRLAEMMDGRISVRSTLGEGSEFTVELPLQEAAPGRAPAAEPSLDGVRVAGTKAPTVEEALLAGQLILLAEDNETNREVMLEQLRLLGYAAEVAEDGVAALEMWRSGRYALLLTDCHMPNMDGFELTAAIRRAEPDDTHLPIIAITANAMQGEAQRCLARGMDDYLSKPLRLNELRPMLAKWLPLADEAAQEIHEEPIPTLLAVWDAATLTRLVGDNPTMHRRLLERFLLSAQEQVAAIGAAATAGDTGTVADVAHKLKSAARTVGATLLGELCQEVESVGRAGEAQTCRALADRLNEAYAVASEDIKASLV